MNSTWFCPVPATFPPLPCSSLFAFFEVKAFWSSNLMNSLSLLVVCAYCGAALVGALAVADGGDSSYLLCFLVCRFLSRTSSPWTPSSIGGPTGSPKACSSSIPFGCVLMESPPTPLGRAPSLLPEVLELNIICLAWFVLEVRG